MGEIEEGLTGTLGLEMMESEVMEVKDYNINFWTFLGVSPPR